MINATVKVSPLHFIEKFEECLRQDLENDELPDLAGTFVKRFLNFRKKKARIGIYTEADEELLARVEIYELSGPGKKTVLKGQMFNYQNDRSENLFFLMEDSGDLAIEAYKSYQNFKALYGTESATATSAAAASDDPDEPTDEEIAQILDMSGSEEAVDLNAGDFLQSMLQEAENDESDAESAKEEKSEGEYSVTLSPDDLLKTIQ